MQAIEEQIAVLGDVRWTVWEDRIANKAWVAGFFSSWSEGRAACRLFAAAVEPEFLARGADWRELADEDWADSYKAHFKAWHIGRRYWVPEWERGMRRIIKGREIVWLDPGLAFGTGNHESTRLCCERLVEYIDAHKSPAAGAPNRSGLTVGDAAEPCVIDAGCGSGILAISACRFGLAPVIGFDNDPIAVRVSRENAELNEVGAKLEFFEGDLASGLARRQARLVLANIHTDVLRAGARELIGAVAPGGWLALSGILVGEIDDLRADFLAMAESVIGRRLDRGNPSRRNSCRPAHSVSGGSARGWKALSRRMGEWADLLLIRGQ